MPLWLKLERRKVTFDAEGAIFQTKVIGNEWFEAGKTPIAYVVDKNEEMWCPIGDTVVSKMKPL